MDHGESIGSYSIEGSGFGGACLPEQRAKRAIADCLGDALQLGKLRALLSQLGHPQIHRLSDHDVVRELQHALDAGRVRVLQTQAPFPSGSGTPVGAPTGGSGAAGAPAHSADAPAPASAEAVAAHAATPLLRQQPPAIKTATAPALKPVPVWIRDMLAIFCPQDGAFLDDLRTRGVALTAFDRIYFDDPYYDGTRWTTKRFEAGGTTSARNINMIRSSSAQENAATVFHEGIHTRQPDSMPWRDKEYQAYAEEDRWRLSHGLPPHDSSFRTRDASGKAATDEAAIRAFVDREYPGVTAAPSGGGPAEQIVGKTKTGKTIVKRADGSSYTRAPQRGDSFPGPEVTLPKGAIPVEMKQLKCP